MKRLFALLGFPYLLTLTAAVLFGSALSQLFCALCLLAFGGVLFLRNRFDIRTAVVVLLTMAFAFGSFSAYASSHVESVQSFDGQKVQITGRLCELPYEQYDKHYYILDVDALRPTEGNQTLPQPKKIRISTQNPLPLDLYDQITGTVQLYAPSGGDGFSSRSYYASKGITLFGFLYEYEGFSVKRDLPKPPNYYVLLARRALLNSVSDLLPQQEASLLSAAVLGEKQGLDPQVKENFTRSGIYHVLVVSGLHMSIISMAVLKLLRTARLPKRPAILITALSVLCFMAITGWSSSVLRSGIMILIMLGGMFVHRRADALNSLGFAVFLISFLNPYAAADLGMLLSFASTLSILVLAPKFKAQFQRWCDRLKFYDRLPKITRRIVSYVLEIFSVTFAVTLFTLPIFLLSGREISLIAPLTNLLLLLPATILIQTGLLAAVLNIVPGLLFLAKPLALISGLLGKLLLWVTGGLASVPYSSASSDYSFLQLWLLFALLMLAFLLLFCMRKRTVVIGGLLAVLVLLCGIGSHTMVRGDTELRIAVLDVGEGLSVVLSHNNTAAVIGCEGYNGNVLPEYLRKEHIRKISYLQLTSGENTEKKNSAALLDAYPTTNVLLPNSLYVTGKLEKSLANGPEVSYYQKSASVALFDDVTLEAGVNSAYLTVGDVTILISGPEYNPDNGPPASRAADFWITDGLPETGTVTSHLTTILSVAEKDLRVIASKDYLDWQTVNIYATAGKGNLLLDFTGGRNLTLRRGD